MNRSPVQGEDVPDDVPEGLPGVDVGLDVADDGVQHGLDDARAHPCGAVDRFPGVVDDEAKVADGIGQHLVGARQEVHHLLGRTALLV